jgi:hypothetical protein
MFIPEADLHLSTMDKLKNLQKNKLFVQIIWFGLTLFPVAREVMQHTAANTHYNDYIIYKHTFLNLTQQHSLFGPQPEYYFDLNHYGPTFSLIIAAFTFLPDGIAVLLWVTFISWMLYWAVMKMPFRENQRLAILLISAATIMCSAQNNQVNPLIAALIILSFIFIRKKQDFWAALMIVLGTAIKLYGIVGLAFFFFSENKLKLILGMFFWSVVLFVLPMIFSSPAYIIKTYHDWYPDLAEKNADNLTSNRTYICVMGMISRIFNYQHLQTLFVLIPAMLLFALSYIRTRCYQTLQYQLLIVASCLIFTVIFSSGSEPPTYIIATIGIGIWFMNLSRKPTAFEIFLLIFALLVTNAPSDVFPKYLRDKYVMPYKLMALPSFIIWLKIIYETVTRKFEPAVEITRN